MTVSPYVYPGCKDKRLLPKTLTPEAQDELAEYYIDVICKYFGTTREVVLKKNRNRDMVKIRNICIYYIRRRTNMGVVRIAKIFKKDHTSILHSWQVVIDQLSSKFDNDYKEDIENLKQLL